MVVLKQQTHRLHTIYERLAQQQTKTTIQVDKLLDYALHSTTVVIVAMLNTVTKQLYNLAKYSNIYDNGFFHVTPGLPRDSVSHTLIMKHSKQALQQQKYRQKHE
jgi:hypothetical protein